MRVDLLISFLTDSGAVSRWAVESSFALNSFKLLKIVTISSMFLTFKNVGNFSVDLSLNA